MMPKLILAAQTVAIVALASVATSIPSTSALSFSEVNGAINQRSEVHSSSWQKRHGDHEDEEEEEHEHDHHMEPEVVHIIQEQSHSHIEPATTTSAHTHSQHMHNHAPHPYDGIPEASKAGLAMIVVPPLPHGAGGHNHGHGGEAPKMELNETAILRGKGPDPLSYIEWDFNYGIGTSEQLERFTNAYNDQSNGEWKDLMGVAGGRYRHLVDERDSEMRKSVIMDIQERIKANKNFVGRHGSLLILHVLGCIISCFIMLPAALALRAASSNLAPLASLIYLITLAGSLFFSMLYKAMTPRLYPSNSHSGLGYAIFWISLIALGGDVFRLIKQIYNTVRSIRNSSKKHSMRVLFDSLSLSSRNNSGEDGYDPLEEERMLSDDGSGISDARELDLERMERHSRRQGSSGSSGSSSPLRSVHFESEEEHPTTHEHTRRSSTRSWSRDLPSPTSTLLNTPRTSVIGELPNVSWKLGHEHDDQSQGVSEWRQNNEDSLRQSSIVQKPKKKFSLLRSIIRYSHVTVARSLPVLSFAAAYTGLTIYTGSCRGAYKNVCLAHGIKGGIFFWYGLLSFARYMGAYADLGWAWNRRPMTKKGKKGNQITAEWVESCVIFVYGATNTWMERFGAEAGDPYTVKQVQHISIAVMFWFAGLMGMILEWGSLKNLLAFPVSLKQANVSRQNRRTLDTLSADEIVTVNSAPPSYNFSFNPFPALVIGVTGIAMAAHHQDYVYEVSIHSLWGNLLAGFSVLRFFTYFFLWLRPPTSSIMPSRPPTEALASFSLACGGLVFMLSSEEVSFVAMRNGFGDFMMILNVTVAIVALLFCWIAGLMVLKAWALKREHIRQQHLSSNAIRLEDSHLQQRSQHPSQDTFVIGTGDDDEEIARAQDEKRQLSTSPEQV